MPAVGGDGQGSATPHSSVQRSPGEKARLAALCDALWQIDAKRQPLEQHVLAPLRQQQQERDTLARAQTAATRGRVPPPLPGEIECWRHVHQGCRPSRTCQGPGAIQGWPIHEEGWKREILRMELDEWAMDWSD